MNTLRNTLMRVGLLGTVFLSGCVSIDSLRERTPDPNQRLNQMLEMSESARRDGSQCHEIWNAQSQNVDCQRIQREVDRLYAEFPNQERVIMANAVLQFESGQMQNAQFLLDQLLAKPGARPEAAILRARIALMEGNTRLAETLLERQISLAPDYAELRETQASVFYLQGRDEKAHEALRIASLLGAPAWRVAYHRGLLHESKLDWRQACHAYIAALRQKPDLRAAVARLLGLSNQAGCEDMSRVLEQYRESTS